ncbi:MAG: TonB-dependent receptor, partial [Parabacteroides sp.]
MDRFFYLRLCLILWLGLFTTTDLYAQVDTTSYHSLSGVEVVGKQRPVVTREAAPLQILDRGGLERLGVQDLSEAVKRFSGVTVQDYGGIGGLKTVSIRSLGAKHTAVSYDGVTLTDASSGQVDISHYTLDNVESVSLSIGQGDDIFQTARMFASAGALSIRTVRPQFEEGHAFRGYAKLKGGSFGLVNPVLHWEQKLASNWCATLHGDYMRADGRYPYTLVNGDLVTKHKRTNSDTKSYHVEGNLFGHWKNGGE